MHIVFPVHSPGAPSVVFVCPVTGLGSGSLCPLDLPRLRSVLDDSNLHYDPLLPFVQTSPSRSLFLSSFTFRCFPSRIPGYPCTPLSRATFTIPDPCIRGLGLTVPSSNLTMKDRYTGVRSLIRRDTIHLSWSQTGHPS